MVSGPCTHKKKLTLGSMPLHVPLKCSGRCFADLVVFNRSRSASLHSMSGKLKQLVFVSGFAGMFAWSFGDFLGGNGDQGSWPERVASELRRSF